MAGKISALQVGETDGTAERAYAWPPILIAREALCPLRLAHGQMHPGGHDQEPILATAQTWRAVWRRFGTKFGGQDHSDAPALES